MPFKNIYLFLIMFYLFISDSYAQSLNASSPTISEKKLQANLQEDDWIHGFHETISNSVFHSASWFDSFFITGNTEQNSPRTVARIKLGWEPKARDWAEVVTRFRVRVHLPHFKDKVDLILSDSPDDDLNKLPLDSVKTAPSINDEKFAAAVRFVHKKSERFVTDSRIGLSGGDIFVRARHRRSYIFSDNHNFRFEPAIYYFVQDGAGARILLEYDYQLNDHEINRIDYTTQVSESFNGLRWKYGFYHLKQITDRRASVLGLQVEGERNGDEGFLIEKYTLNYRYRFNALRKWIFFEIEPFLEFPEEHDYKTTPGLALRVEGFFFRQ